MRYNTLYLFPQGYISISARIYKQCCANRFSLDFHKKLLAGLLYFIEKYSKMKSEYVLTESGEKGMLTASKA